MFHESQPISPASGSLVGTISRWNPSTGRTSDPKSIYSREEIYVGRDWRRCQYVVDDPFVSNKHLWIYTVIFDQDNPGEIAPLVYAQDISMNGTLWNGYRMGNGRSSFLLSDGDVIQLANGVFLKFYSEDHTDAKCFTSLQAVEMKAFANDYTITQRKLGSGAYGQVHMAFKRSTGQQFACKIVDLQAVKQRLAVEGAMRHEQKYKKTISPGVKSNYVKSLLQRKLDQYHREARILETLQHPNIIGLEKVIRSGNTIYMFEDLLTAGDLFSYIQYKSGKLPDIEAAVIVRQIAIALRYLHGKNIVHRDLKPDNILMTSRADGCRVVLTDFGCATLLESTSNRMSSMVGTFEFSAPEVVKKSEEGYTKAADLWSLGCLTAVLLIGEPPFDDLPIVWNTIAQQQAAIRDLMAKLDRHKVGERAQNFVFRLLQYDISERMDVKQALQHSWFTNPSHKSDFEALYRRSIRDWKSRTAKEPRIVGLEDYFRRPSSQLSPESSNSEDDDQSIQLDTPSTSEGTPQSTSSTDDSSAEQNGSLPSDNLSDPMLQPPGNIDTKTHPPQSSQQSGSANPKWLSTVYHREPKPRVQPSYSLSETEYRPQHVSTTYQSETTPPPPTSNSLRVKALVGARILAAQSVNKETYNGRRPQYSTDGVEGEVYEEVINPVTGKRERLTYGACVYKLQ